jgi:hypothetical protein
MVLGIISKGAGTIYRIGRTSTRAVAERLAYLGARSIVGCAGDCYFIIHFDQWHISVDGVTLHVAGKQAKQASMNGCARFVAGDKGAAGCVDMPLKPFASRTTYHRERRERCRKDTIQNK